MGASPAEMQEHDLPPSGSGDEHSNGLSKKGTPWSTQEHYAFLKGLEKLGKGNWRGISRYYVPSRTPTQVASHAQKHFLRLGGNTKRRSRFAAIEEEVYGAQGAKAPSPTTSNPPTLQPSAPTHQQQAAPAGMASSASSFLPPASVPAAHPAPVPAAPKAEPQQTTQAEPNPPQAHPGMHNMHHWLTQQMQHTMAHMAAVAHAQQAAPAAGTSPAQPAAPAVQSKHPVPVWLPPGMAWAAHGHPHMLIYNVHPHAISTPASQRSALSTAPTTDSPAEPRSVQTNAALHHSPPNSTGQQQQQQTEQQPQSQHVIADGIPCAHPHMMMPGYQQQPAIFWHPAHGMMPHPGAAYPAHFMYGQPGAAVLHAPAACDPAPAPSDPQSGPPPGPSTASSVTTVNSTLGSGAPSLVNTAHMLQPVSEVCMALTPEGTYTVPVKPEAMLAAWPRGACPPSSLDMVLSQLAMPVAGAHLHHSQHSAFTTIMPYPMMS